MHAAELPSVTQLARIRARCWRVIIRDHCSASPDLFTNLVLLSMFCRQICRSSIAAFFTIVASAQAETFTWDPANDAAVTAMGGVWDTTTPNWLGAPTRHWPNETAAGADLALFTGSGIAPFVVNLGQPITANGLTFE